MPGCGRLKTWKGNFLSVLVLILKYLLVDHSDSPESNIQRRVLKQIFCLEAWILIDYYIYIIIPLEVVFFCVMPRVHQCQDDTKFTELHTLSKSTSLLRICSGCQANTSFLQSTKWEISPASEMESPLHAIIVVNWIICEAINIWLLNWWEVCFAANYYICLPAGN